MNYAIWSILGSRACDKPHSSVNALNASLMKAWPEIMPEVIVRSCVQFPDRLEKLIPNNGVVILNECPVQIKFSIFFLKYVSANLENHNHRQKSGIRV